MRNNKIGHLREVNSVIFSFDNKFMVSIERNVIRVWEVVKGIELKTFLIKDGNRNIISDELIFEWLLF